MSSSTPTPPEYPSRIRQRWRQADRIAQRLAAEAAEGRFHDRIWQWECPISFHPVLQRVLHEAPLVAACAEPGMLRVARTPRGQITVVRLHGPDWSLVLTPGRPLPGYLLAVLDINPADDPYALSMLDPDWAPELAAMCAAILDVADS